MNKIVTRFAPSPTGLLHAGNYRTALFAYIFAKQNKGRFLLRIEDTDRVRSKKEYEDNIIESMKWLGMEYDVFYRQSDRVDVYRKYITKLIDSNLAYISDEAIKDADNNTSGKIIRFRNPNKRVAFDDLIRGRIEFNTTELGDFVIAKNIDEPVFHLAVVIDDNDMGITHIIRGEDHISNTPRQILLYEALGFQLPQYAHIPLLLAPDKSKLSKRKGALPITNYRDRGYLKEAIINYLSYLGWNPGTEQEIMSMDELIDKFSLDKVQKSGAIFNEEKLNWFNKKYIEKMSIDEFSIHTQSYIDEKLDNNVLLLLKEKIHNFSEIKNILNSELSFIRILNTYEKESLLWKGKGELTDTKKIIGIIIKILEKLTEFNKEKIKEAIWPTALEIGKGEVLWPMRYALSGQEKSPDPFIIAEILGKNETLKRLLFAYELL